MSESGSSRLPRFLPVTLKHQLHCKACPLGDEKCWFQPFLGNSTAPDSLQRATSSVCPMFSEAQTAVLVFSSFLSNHVHFAAFWMDGKEPGEP